MTRHFHLIAPRSSSRTAVRDLQNVTRGIRSARTSGTLTVQGLRGTHSRADAPEEAIRQATATAITIPRWG